MGGKWGDVRGKGGEDHVILTQGFSFILKQLGNSHTELSHMIHSHTLNL